MGIYSEAGKTIYLEFYPVSTAVGKNKCSVSYICEHYAIKVLLFN